jgi:hypothetical protein
VTDAKDILATLDAHLPPVNARAEQVHRIRQRLTNIRAYIGTDVDDVALSGLGFAIDDLIALEQALRYS